MRKSSTLGLLAVLSAACGIVDNPDLQTGTVEGRIVGASAGGFAYPLGRPDLKVPLDPGGAFSIAGVPVGPQEIVFFDGTVRADRASVLVRSAYREVLPDRFGDAAVVPEETKMPLAGRVIAAVRLEGGGLPVDPRFAVEETDSSDVPAAFPGGIAVLWPLPSGYGYDVTARVAGFRGASALVDVPAGTALVEIELEIDDDLSVRGCAANEDRCLGGLFCSAGDGACHECLSDGDCPDGGACDPETLLCDTDAAAPDVEFCTACADASSCGSGAVCVKPAAGGMGYCSIACPGGVAECPAGFDCLLSTCVAVRGCTAYLGVFGAPCIDGSTCGASQGLVGGSCRGADVGESPAAGYCTATCDPARDCSLAGTFVCNPIERVCDRL